MFLKIKLLSISIFTGALLILFLCLGSQNIKTRYSLNLLLVDTVKLPAGFLVGSSFIIGFLGGSTTAILLTNSEINK